MKLPQYRLLKISASRKGTSIVAEWVDVVTCGECKWFDSGKNDSEIWSMCTRHFGKYIDVNADDFCSYGSRSERGSE